MKSEADLPFNDIKKYDNGIYWFEDRKNNELSREDRQAKIIDIYAHEKAVSMTEQEKQAHIDKTNSSIGSRQDIKDEDFALYEYLINERKERKMEIINENSKGIEVINDNGAWYDGTYYVIDNANYNGQDLFLLESEEYGEDEPCVIVDKNNNVIIEDVNNGFDDYLERREDLVEKYYLTNPIAFKDNDGNKVNITQHYVLPHDLKFVDSENREYEYLLGTINVSDMKLFLKAENGDLLYSGKLDKAYENGEFNLTDTLNVDDYSFSKLGNAIELTHHTQMTLHFRYDEEKEMNGWRKYVDEVTFDNFETAMKYANKEEAVYDYLDNYYEPRNDETPLYVTNNENLVVWENEAYVYEMVEKIKNGEIPRDKVTENIMTLKGMNAIYDFDLVAKDEVIGAEFLKETVYEDSSRHYSGWLSTDTETKKVYYIEFNNNEVDEILYKGKSLVSYYEKESELEKENAELYKAFSDYSQNNLPVPYTYDEVKKAFENKEELFIRDIANSLLTQYKVSADNQQEYDLLNKFANAKDDTIRSSFLQECDKLHSTVGSISVAEILEQRENNDPHREDGIETHTPYVPSSEDMSEDDMKKEAIMQGVGAVMSSNEFANYVKTVNRLMYNSYSPRNCGLILNQYIGKYCESNNIDVLKLSNEEMGKVVGEALKSDNVPTYLMGYEAWKDYGRQVTGKGVAYTVVAPNYVNEYNGKGSIIKAMEKKFNEDFKKDSSRDYSEFVLEKTGISFRSYGQKGNNLVDVCVNGNTILGKQSIEDVRKYLNDEVIDKIPKSYSVTCVYDVKNTVVPEHLWVKYNFKNSELELDEKGEPITRKLKNSKMLEYKIKNTEERISKFNPDLSMDIKGLNEEKANILFETLQEVSARKGVPMTVESIEGEARGFYHTQEKRIAISDKLDPVSRCATAIHEMAHADLHSMPNTKNRNTKEVEAEAVSYFTSQHFGIETDVKSFNYLAGWSKGRDLKELENSMGEILKESKKLEDEISKELESRGYNIALEPIVNEQEKEAKEDMTIENVGANKEEIAGQENVSDLSDTEKTDDVTLNYIKCYKIFVLSEKNELSNKLEELKTLSTFNDDERSVNILNEQRELIGKMNRKLVTIDKNLNMLENASASDIDKIKTRIDNHFKDYNDIRYKLDASAYEFVERKLELANMEKASFKDRFNNEPIATMKEYIKASDNEKLQKLTDKDLKYIASSYYLKSNYGKEIATDFEKYLMRGAERVDIINDVKAKNGQFIEVAWCEQWFDKPIVESGALMSPATANKLFGEAEKDIEKLKEVAEKNDDYIPYSKCRFTIYTETKDDLLATSTRMDIGDGYQTDLTSFLSKDLSNNTVLEAYNKAVKERSLNKIYEPSKEPVAQTKDDLSDEKVSANMSDNKKVFSADELKDFVSHTGDSRDNAEQTKNVNDHNAVKHKSIDNEK